MVAPPKSSLAAIALVVAGCGPSHRMVHQSNVQFERCHSAELAESDTEVPYECWDQWIRHHAEGQPAHRVAYARSRMDALAQGETMARLPDGTPGPVAVATAASMSDAAPAAGDVARDPATPPAPETAPVAPPVAAADSSSAAGAAPAAAPAAPDEESVRTRKPAYRGDPTCQPVCGPPWDRCIARCDDGRMPCVTACENEYRACMGGCF